MRLEFQEGRATKAAQLHAMERLEPQWEFWDGGEVDKWTSDENKGNGSGCIAFPE